MKNFSIFTSFHFSGNVFRHLIGKQRREYKNYDLIKKILGFRPDKIEYYELAFVHRSSSKISLGGVPLNNERLEYLGDAILGAVIADMLFHKFPNADEGFLTQMRSKIVNGENLSKLAKDIGINKFVVSNTNVILSKKNIFGDAFEALIGAVYLDKGYQKTEHFIINRVIKNHVDLDLLESTDTNYKSKLIEWGQKYKREIGFYTDLESYDSKVFVCYIRIDNEIYGSGKGKSKKEAEQSAAKKTLTKVEVGDNIPI